MRETRKLMIFVAFYGASNDNDNTITTKNGKSNVAI